MSTTKELTHREKELVAVAASIAAGCLPCTIHHVKTVREAGATEAEILKTIGIALDVQDNAAEMMAEAAQGNLNYEYPDKTQSRSMEQPIDHLVAIGAALACNSVAGLEHYWAKATAAGASTRQILVVTGIVRAIRKAAAEKADAMIGLLLKPIQGKAEIPEKQKGSVAPSCGCS